MPYYFTELGHGMVLIGDRPMTQQPWAYEKAKNKIALPTIGRVVHLYDSTMTGADKPYLGMVADVIGGHTINAVAFNHDGDLLVGGIQNVPHESDKPADAKVWWDWMDFQKGQAAKTEELQRALDTKTKGVGAAIASGQGAAGTTSGGE